MYNPVNLIFAPDASDVEKTMSFSVKTLRGYSQSSFSVSINEFGNFNSLFLELAKAMAFFNSSTDL